MGLRVARVTRGLQRRSSECVSDMAGCVVLESTWCFCVLHLRDGKVQGRKVDEHGPAEGIKSSDRVAFWIMYKTDRDYLHQKNAMLSSVRIQEKTEINTCADRKPRSKQRLFQLFFVLHHHTTASSSSGTSSNVSLLDPLRPPWNMSLNVALKLLSLFLEDPGLCSGALVPSLNASMASVRDPLPDGLRRPPVDGVSTMPRSRLSATIADSEEESGFVSGPGRICVKVFRRPGVTSLGSI